MEEILVLKMSTFPRIYQWGIFNPISFRLLEEIFRTRNWEEEPVRRRSCWSSSRIQWPVLT